MTMTAQPELMRLPQGDTRLLQTDLAQRLLQSTLLARLAYIATDATPRVLPMLFHWNGSQLILPTFANSRKLGSLRANPAVAVTIDAMDGPPEVLLLRGRVEITEQDGILPEYRAAHVRYFGPEQGAANVAQADRPGVRMARIALEPSWVGLLDFQQRLPGAMQ
jgi:general stress protein 26